MAGRERSGAVAARGDLFDGRAWVVVPHDQSSQAAVEAVTSLAVAAGGTVSTMDPAEHDAAVAVVSHVPQLASSLVAGRLRELTDPAVALSGQGIRDVTRVAASDPQLWTQILAGNAAAVRAVLVHLHAELTEVIGALDVLTDGDGVGAREVLARIVAQGNAGHARIPGKHGAAPTAYSVVVVLVPDRPGELARLLHDVGDAGVNLEDLHLEHGLGQPFGLAEVSVLPAVAERLGEELTARGWRLHG
jgi:prephenate dehydrogenase